MSGTQLAIEGGDGTFEGHDCFEDDDRTPLARVTVNGNTIPIINDGLRTEIRKDEAMGLTRYSEVYFPAEWNGYNYENQVRALDPNESNVYDPVDIEIKNYVTDELELVHRGFVMGVGGGSHGDIEMRMTVGDPGQLLGGIPFDGKYDEDSELIDVVEDVVDVMEEAVTPHVFDSISLQVGVDTGDDDTEGDAGITTSGKVALAKAAPLPGTQIINADVGLLRSWIFDSDKTFHGHVDTAADALNWVEEHVDDGIFYFVPDGDGTGVTLVFDTEYPSPTFTAHNIDASGDGEIEVYRNNAIHEIRPINMATVNGAVNDGEAPTATAIHTNLLERASVPQVITEEDDSVDTLISTENRAEELLEDEIERSSLGRILTAPAPSVQPHATIVSQPACGNEVERSTAPFEYEVDSIVHRLCPEDSDGNRRHQTEMKVSPNVDSDDIVIKESKMVEVTEPDESRWERAKSIADDVTDVSFPAASLVGGSGDDDEDDDDDT